MRRFSNRDNLLYKFVSALCLTMVFLTLGKTVNSEDLNSTNYKIKDVSIGGGGGTHTAACEIGHSDNGDGTCTVRLGNPTEDGYIRGGFIYTKYDSDNYISFGDMAGDPVRGYIEWDISSIPDSASITSSLLEYHGYYDNGSPGSSNSIVQLNKNQPSATSASNIFTDIGSGGNYVSLWNPVESDNQEVTLGSSANSDLESQLSSDWFAIGFYGDETNPADGIYSEEYSSADPPPTLAVTYTPTANVFNLISSVNGDLNDERFDSTNYNLGSGVTHVWQATAPSIACFETVSEGSTSCSDGDVSPDGMVMLCGEGGCFDRARFELNAENNPSDTLYSIQITTDSGWGSWDFVDGSTYLIENAANHDINDYLTESNWENTASSINLLGLDPNTTYYIRATALNGDFTESGPGPDSNATTSASQVTFDIDVLNESDGVATGCDAGHTDNSDGTCTVTLQPGAEGKDAHISEYYPNLNAGDSTSLITGVYGFSGEDYWALVEWDLSEIPAGVTISSATFEQYIDNTYAPSGGSLNIGVYPISSSWNESTVTWNTGRPSLGAVISGSTVSYNTLTGLWRSHNITSLVQDWADGTVTNYGMAVKETDGSTTRNRIQCYSSDYTTNTSLREKLVVTYVKVGSPGTELEFAL